MDRRQTLALALLLVALLLAGCGNRASGLLGTTWRLIEIDGQAPLAGTEATLHFEGQEVSGNTGCNQYFGEYTAGRSELGFGVLGQTEMACLEPEGLMAQERAYLDALSRAEQFTVADDQLRVLCKGGDVLVFALVDH